MGGGAPEPAARVADGVTLLRSLDASLDSLRGLIERGPRSWEEMRTSAERTGPTLALSEVEPVLPVEPRDYVDFYASLEHATTVGRLFRPEGEPLAANWRRLPVGYHGRASTVVVSGTPVARPHGQIAPGELAPTAQLDLECELGFFAGPSTRPGERVPIAEAAARIFGFVLLNDWSARDVQRFETQPLGPFLGKSFATTISPWIVPPSELRLVTPVAQDPPPPPYLHAATGQDGTSWAVDLDIEVRVDGKLRATCNPRGLYWTPAQMLAHATVNGAALTAGDLFGTGTISGWEPATRGCLLEHGFDGGPHGWLPDGATVTLSAEPLGECAGTIRPAR